MDKVITPIFTNLHFEEMKHINTLVIEYKTVFHECVLDRIFSKHVGEGRFSHRKENRMVLETYVDTNFISYVYDVHEDEIAILKTYLPLETYEGICI